MWIFEVIYKFILKILRFINLEHIFHVLNDFKKDNYKDIKLWIVLITITSIQTISNNWDCLIILHLNFKIYELTIVFCDYK
jgi:hypothetical protein